MIKGEKELFVVNNESECIGPVVNNGLKIFSFGLNSKQKNEKNSKILIFDFGLKLLSENELNQRISVLFNIVEENSQIY